MICHGVVHDVVDCVAFCAGCGDVGVVSIYGG